MRWTTDRKHKWTNKSIDNIVCTSWLFRPKAYQFHWHHMTASSNMPWVPKARRNSTHNIEAFEWSTVTAGFAEVDRHVLASVCKGSELWVARLSVPLQLECKQTLVAVDGGRGCRWIMQTPRCCNTNRHLVSIVYLPPPVAHNHGKVLIFGTVAQNTANSNITNHTAEPHPRDLD